MKLHSLGLAALVSFSFLSVTQAQITTFEGTRPTSTSAVFLYDRGAQALVGHYTVTHGTPDWKDEYSKMVESEKDSAMRLGRDSWTILDTSLALEIGGTKVPAGVWYLGLGKKGGKFVLMVLDSESCKAKRLPPWQTETATAKINAPLTHAEAGAAADKLAITVTANKSDASKGEFKIHWGPHQLTAPVVVSVPAKKASNASGKKGEK